VWPACCGLKNSGGELGCSNQPFLTFLTFSFLIGRPSFPLDRPTDRVGHVSLCACHHKSVHHGITIKTF